MTLTLLAALTLLPVAHGIAAAGAEGGVRAGESEVMREMHDAAAERTGAAAPEVPGRRDTLPATSPTAPAGMVALPGGRYTPQFASVAEDGDFEQVAVDPFALDRTPVTVGDFLDFVRAEPTWRRDRVPTVLAGERYLGSWDSALEPGLRGELLDRPVTEVSWFAARAYCQWRGVRLPSTDEWEYAASASAERTDAALDPDFNRVLRELQSRRPTPDDLPPVGRTFRNAFGVWDMHGVIWEWTSDFNARMATGAGRDDQGLDRQLFCAAGSEGATDRSDYTAFLRYAFRTSLTGAYAAPTLGFRCARDVEAPRGSAVPTPADPPSTTSTDSSAPGG